MRNNNKDYGLICLCFLLLLRALNVLGFEVDTHTLLSQRAVGASQLNSYLTTVLGFEFRKGVVRRSGKACLSR
jgi:hypothetical protein